MDTRTWLVSVESLFQASGPPEVAVACTCHAMVTQRCVDWRLKAAWLPGPTGFFSFPSNFASVTEGRNKPLWSAFRSALLIRKGKLQHIEYVTFLSVYLHLVTRSATDKDINKLFYHRWALRYLYPLSFVLIQFAVNTFNPESDWVRQGCAETTIYLFHRKSLNV